MTKLFFLIFLLPLVLLGQSNKTEAINAFEEIIKCYYDKDCNKYYSFWADSVSTLNKDTNFKYPSSRLISNKKSNCSHFNQVIKETKTYENYLANFDIEAVTYSEFKNQDRKKLVEKYEAKKSNAGWTLGFITLFNKYYMPNDVLVIGDIPKDGSKYIGLPYVYLLRKTNKGWKIIGVQY